MEKIIEKNKGKKLPEGNREGEDKGRIAVIRIRGAVNASVRSYETFMNLRLYRKNYCVVIDNTKENLGMVKKIKDYIAWGELSEESFKELVEKRGREFKGRETDSRNKIKYKFLSINGKKLKPYFRLSPPRGGFERKGIKTQFSEGGALGYRGKKINDLVKRML